MKNVATADLDIFALWEALRKGITKLLILALLAGGATYAVLSSMAPRYTSEAQLAITSKITNPFPEARSQGGSADSVTPRLDREAINTHVKALMAPDLLLTVAHKLKLSERPEFNSARGSVDLYSRILRMAGIGAPNPAETDDNRVLAVIRHNLVVSAARETRFITISFSSVDPKLAAKFANTLAEDYRKGLVDAPVNETKDVVKALTPKIEQLKREVLNAEAVAERYRAETDQLRGGAGDSPANARRMAALNEELTKAEAAANSAESKWVTARDLSRNGSPEVLPEVQNSPLIQGLIGQRVRLERQVFEAQATLLPAHPRMRQLNSDLRGLKRTIAVEVAKVVGSLEKNYRAATVRVESIKRQLAEQKSHVVANAGKESKLRELESTAKSKRTELERLLKQVEDNRTLAATRAVPVEAQVVSFARASGGTPTFPKKSSTMLLVMAGTLILGLAWMIARVVILASRPQASRADANAAEMRNGEPALAGAAVVAGPGQVAHLAPVPGGKAAPSRNAAHDEPASAELATLAGIARHLIRRKAPEVGCRSLVASERSAIDPSDEAVVLARELDAAGHRVMLVEWSLEGEDFAADLGLEEDQPGMTELILGEAEFDDVIICMPGCGVHVIGAGAPVQLAGDVLDADAINLILDTLDEAYDQIIVVGRFDPAQALFETIEGRFDAGIVVSDARRTRPIARHGDDTFLGFEVTDIDVIHYERSTLSATSSRRLQIAEPAAEVV